MQIKQGLLIYLNLMFGGSKHIPSFDTHYKRVERNNAFTNTDIPIIILHYERQQRNRFWLECDECWK
jgi:hypothetical protein